MVTGIFEKNNLAIVVTSSYHLSIYEKGPDFSSVGEIRSFLSHEKPEIYGWYQKLKVNVQPCNVRTAMV